MAYIDMFVAPIAPGNKEAFTKFSKICHEVLIDCGALSVLDAWDDDVPEGDITSFRKAVQASADEVVTAGWIIWPDKATRDTGMEKMMSDPRMNDANPMPFDGKRMIFGGFNPIVETPAQA
ncbi:DUF1428 domain-containing protein [Tateyamaria armeniaca]|uniref:DUF1428 domain-containing protein n=1 Tax=Tateyamaria armeniaca TaxID=2518930 RepID=A0ABW8UQD2_9RHOB